MRSIKIPLMRQIVPAYILALALALALAAMMPSDSYGFWPFSSMIREKEPKVLPVVDEAGEFELKIREMSKELITNLETSEFKDSLLDDGIAVCTFVDLKNLYKSSSFGRYLAEQLMSEFQQQGYPVVEIRKSVAITMQEKQGEYGLSRNPEDVKADLAARTMLTGTYTLTGDSILINARIMDNKDAILLSSATIIFHRNQLCNILLADTSTLIKPTNQFIYMKRLEL
ncbi:MAG: FlgO family outer membrane protein [Thermodesulfobacteriota bacterium]|nr:FlgO family outer membrane protein [Thermodesulfobacteriota bacterium]